MKGQIMDKKIIILLSGFILAVILLTGCGNNEVASEYHIEYLNKEKTKTPSEVIAEFLEAVLLPQKQQKNNLEMMQNYMIYWF